MKKSFYLILSLSFVFSLFAKTEQMNSLMKQRYNKELAKAKYIKATYLKGNIKNKIRILKKRIKLLSEKESLSKKMQKQLTETKQELGKILFWQKYFKMSLNICELCKTSRERAKAARTSEGNANAKPTEKFVDPLEKTLRERATLKSRYLKLTGQKFPKNFKQGVAAYIKRK